MDIKQANDAIMERVDKRDHFFKLAAMMLCNAKIRGLRLIMENPWSQQHYLKSGFVMPPTMIDQNRMLRGDYFMKPTAYWFINCEPTIGLMTIQKDKEKKIINQCKHGIQAGICSEERSMISPDYARNFICDFILEKEQKGTQLSMFEL